jgi:hypothetical protein
MDFSAVASVLTVPDLPRLTAFIGPPVTSESAGFHGWGKLRDGGHGALRCPIDSSPASSASALSTDWKISRLYTILQFGFQRTPE